MYNYDYLQNWLSEPPKFTVFRINNLMKFDCNELLICLENVSIALWRIYLLQEYNDDKILYIVTMVIHLLSKERNSTAYKSQIFTS